LKDVDASNDAVGGGRTSSVGDLSLSAGI